MSNPLVREVTKISYSVEIPEDDFLALIRYERDVDWNYSLDRDLEVRTCATDHEYNGMFGCYIFFSLDQGDDTADEWEYIQTIIKEHIAKAKRIVKQNRG